ncbi:MAG TPA: HWE histidine kinase domain-containing protein [Caulobacteraceae bacterium]
MKRPRARPSANRAALKGGTLEAKALRQTEQRLEFALGAARLGSWEFDIAAGRFSSAAHSRAIFGLGPDDPFDTTEDVVALVHPDDRALRQAAVDRAIATGEDLEVEYRIVKPSGEIGWIMARGRAAFENGRAVRLAGISLDITARRTAEDRQRLLLDELNHRVKNTLATVQSIAMQTLTGDEKGSGDGNGGSGAYREAFIARLLALAGAHDLLTEAAWEGASLGDVVRRTLALCVPGDRSGRVSAGGPAVRLGPNAAVTLNMAFYELAANAMKYGALATPAGRVEVRWWADDADKAIAMDWRETGGPPVSLPGRRGFGSRLIERGLAREFGGSAQLSFLPDGLWCHIRLPFSAKLALAV